MSFKVAVVQPMAHKPPDDKKNIADAIEYIKQASEEAQSLLHFPNHILDHGGCPLLTILLMI